MKPYEFGVLSALSGICAYTQMDWGEITQMDIVFVCRAIRPNRRG